jgi:hypothetical protein
MKSIFDLFSDKKAGVDAEEARSKQQWQSREARMARVLRESWPVFKEYQSQLQRRGIAAQLIPIGDAGLQLKVSMKWTFGIIAFERDHFVTYIESDPGKSNGYVRNDYTKEVAPPSPDPWAGTDALRGFLDRSLKIFIQRFDHGAIGSGIVGP